MEPRGNAPIHGQNVVPKTSPVVHDASEALSPTHVPSYLALAFASGSVNAGAFLACERFVSHVTGTVTRVGLDLSMPTLLAESLTVLVAFVLGAMTSVVALDARAIRGLPPRPDVVLLGVALVLVGIATLGSLGLFGPFGAASEQGPDFLLLAALSFTMGAMNASVASSTALAVRTTHMTGPASDLGVQLGRAFVLLGDDRRRAYLLAGLRGGKILAFAAGAAANAFAAPSLSHLVFLVPAVVVVGATLRSFLPVSRRLDASTARAAHA